MTTTKVVLFTPFEACQVAEGRKIQLRTSDGELVMARLYTVDELMAAHKEACEAAGDQPSMTRNQARFIVSPRDVRMMLR